MRIFWDSARDDYRLEMNKHDVSDSAPFHVKPEDDTLALAVMTKIIQIFHGSSPECTMSTRHSYATALVRALAYLYGEDLADDPLVPTLAKCSMNRAQALLRNMPTAEPFWGDSGLRENAERMRAENQRLSNEHDYYPRHTDKAPLDDLYGDM